MATEIQTVINIQTVGAAKSVKDLKKEISDLRDQLVKLDAGSEQYRETVELLITDEKKLTEVMSAGKKEITATTGSYNALCNEMSALKKVWKEVGNEIERNKIGQRIKEINDQLKEMDSSIGNNQRKVGSYEEAIENVTQKYKTQRQELAALKAAMDNMDEGSAEYEAAFRRASEITHNLTERQELLKLNSYDLGDQLDNLTKMASGFVAGFSALNAIMGLFGEQNEDIQKAMLKTQQMMQLVQGIKGMEGLTKNISAWINSAARLFDTYVLGREVVEEHTTAQYANTDSQNANTTAKVEGIAASSANTAALEKEKDAVSELTLREQLYRLAIKKTSLERRKSYMIKDGLSEDSYVIKKINSEVEELDKQISKIRNTINNPTEYVKDVEKETEKLKSEVDGVKEATEGAAEATEKAAEATSKWGKIFKGLGMTALITGLIYLFGKLISEISTAVKKTKELNASRIKDQQTLLDYENELIAKIEERFEREQELAVAQGATEIDILNMKQKHYEEYYNFLGGQISQLNRYYDQLIEKQEEMDNYDYVPYISGERGLGLPEEVLNQTITTTRVNGVEIKKNIKAISQEFFNMLDAGNKGAENSYKIFKEQLDKIREEGITTWSALRTMVLAYQDALTTNQENAGANKSSSVADAKIKLAEMQTELADAAKEEIQLENDAYNKRMKSVKAMIAQNKSLQSDGNKVMAALTKDHYKKIHSIITAATQSIVDEVAESSMNEVQILTKKYNEELKILKKYGVDTTELTKKYVKDREKLIVEQEEKNYQRLFAIQNKETQLQWAVTSAKTRYEEYLKAMETGWQSVEKYGIKSTEDLTIAIQEQEKAYKDAMRASEDYKRSQTEKIYTNDRDALWKNKAEYLKADVELKKAAYESLVQAFDESDEEFQARLIQAKKELDLAKEAVVSNDIQQQQNQLDANAINTETYMGVDSMDAYQARLDAEIWYRDNLLKLQDETNEEYALRQAEANARVVAAQAAMNQQRIDNYTNLAVSVGSIMGSIADWYEEDIQARYDAGKISEQQAKDEFETVKAFQISQSVISTIAGAVQAYMSCQSLGFPWGTILGAIQAATVTAAGVAEIAKIKNTQFGSDSTASESTLGALTTPNVSDYTATPVENITGLQETEDITQAINNKNYVVSVVDINDAQNKVSVRETESSF